MGTIASSATRASCATSTMPYGKRRLLKGVASTLERIAHTGEILAKKVGL